MANLASALKQEITRIARREIRAQTLSTKKASTQHRRHIAVLRRRIASLEQSIHRLTTRVGKEAAAPTPPSDRGQIRFVAKGVRSLRERLGLSAERFGELIGVSGQSIYNWERQVTTPRTEQLKLLASVRGIGKREAAARLDARKAKPAAKSA